MSVPSSIRDRWFLARTAQAGRMRRGAGRPAPPPIRGRRPAPRRPAGAGAPARVPRRLGREPTPRRPSGAPTPAAVAGPPACPTRPPRRASGAGAGGRARTVLRGRVRLLPLGAVPDRSGHAARAGETGRRARGSGRPARPHGRADRATPHRGAATAPEGRTPGPSCSRGAGQPPPCRRRATSSGVRSTEGGGSGQQTRSPPAPGRPEAGTRPSVPRRGPR